MPGLRFCGGPSVRAMTPNTSKRLRVTRMFSTLVPVYDRMNRLVSFGLDARWRRSAARRLDRRAPVLDVGAGTGDLALAVIGTGNPGPVILLDPSIEMLRAARAKAAARGVGRDVLAVVAQGERLPVREGAAAGVVSAFVLRNLEDPPGFFAQAHAALAPDGRAVFLEIARPPRGLRRRLFSIYFFHVMPAAARLLTGQGAAYSYLARSVEAFPSPEEVRDAMERAGFSGARSRRLAGGMVAIYEGVRGAR
jgi:demethylmenaquinone methyltransferase/2-methoxy-6-polyprenyl-1,4-benzoquinol methylase